MSKQPRDDANAPIPVLGLRPERGLQLAVSSTANRSVQISNSVRVVTLYSTIHAFIEIGDETVEANTSNSHLLPATLPYDVSLGAERNINSPKYISIISYNSSETGTLYISERE